MVIQQFCFFIIVIFFKYFIIENCISYLNTVPEINDQLVISLYLQPPNKWHSFSFLPFQAFFQCSAQLLRQPEKLCDVSLLLNSNSFYHVNSCTLSSYIEEMHSFPFQIYIHIREKIVINALPFRRGRKHSQNFFCHSYTCNSLLSFSLHPHI